MLLQADVSDEARVRAMIGEHIQHFGKLDILVNNAATTFFIDLADFESMTEDKWDRIYAVNVKGLFWCTRAAAPALRTAKGCVINIASMAGFSGKGSSIAYGASKAAVIALTKGLASAMAPDVRVNAIAPGMVDSPWNTGRSERVQRAAAGTPLGRVPTSADIGEVVLDLASGFSLATGMTVQIDGGASL
jgi:3-oxoacyl-[acyl-carrier protein] reductase